MDRAPALGCIKTLDSGSAPKINQYHLTISQLRACTCPNFKEMVTKATGKRGQWANCKHLYYVFAFICGLDPDSDSFIHVASFSFNELKQIIESGLLTHTTSQAHALFESSTVVISFQSHQRKESSETKRATMKRTNFNP